MSGMQPGNFRQMERAHAIVLNRKITLRRDISPPPCPLLVSIAGIREFDAHLICRSRQAIFLLLLKKLFFRFSEDWCIDPSVPPR
jgi:hypothetical protein